MPYNLHTISNQNWDTNKSNHFDCGNKINDLGKIKVSELN